MRPTLPKPVPAVGDTDNNLGDKKTYDCAKCDMGIDRDLNDAINILKTYKTDPKANNTHLAYFADLVDKALT